jgi:GNAT superfamily N-acetyltransferase
MRSGVRVRPAGTTDRHAILDVDRLTAAGGAERIREIDAAIEQGNCMLAEVDGEAAGYCVTVPSHFFGRDFIELLVVRSTWRRTGIGHLLLSRAVDAAETSRVFTSTNRSNAAMRSLLVAGGWTFAGQVDGLDAGDPEQFFYTDRETQ